MNTLFATTVLCAGSLVSAATPLVAAENVRAAPPIVVDCARRALPSQRQVGEILGQANFSQVYASRARVMAEVGRACRKPEARHVRLVREEKVQRARPAVRRVALYNDPSR